MGQRPGEIPHREPVLEKDALEVDPPVAELVPGLELRLSQGKGELQHRRSRHEGQHPGRQQLPAQFLCLAVYQREHRADEQQMGAQPKLVHTAKQLQNHHGKADARQGSKPRRQPQLAAQPEPPQQQAEHPHPLGNSRCNHSCPPVSIRTASTAKRLSVAALVSPQVESVSSSSPYSGATPVS